MLMVWSVLVCSVFLRQCIFQVIKKKKNSSAYVLNSYNFAILRSLFYSRNVCVKNRNIQLFRERLSEKVHATIPKGIVGGF